MVSIPSREVRSMIKFIPRDIGLWRNNDGTLRFEEKLFETQELFESFLMSNPRIMISEENPLEFNGPRDHHVFGSNTFSVKCWITIGWCVEV